MSSWSPAEAWAGSEGAAALESSHGNVSFGPAVAGAGHETDDISDILDVGLGEGITNLGNNA